MLATRRARIAATVLDRYAVVLCLLTSITIDSPFNFAALGALGLFSSQVYLLATSGQSLGKRVMGIQVVRTDGSPVSLSRLIILRNLVPILLEIMTCNILTYVDWFMLLARDRRCFHDLLADTKVIVVDKSIR